MAMFNYQMILKKVMLLGLLVILITHYITHYVAEKVLNQPVHSTAHSTWILGIPPRAICTHASH